MGHILSTPQRQPSRGLDRGVSDITHLLLTHRKISPPFKDLFVTQILIISSRFDFIYFRFDFGLWRCQVGYRILLELLAWKTRRWCWVSTDQIASDLTRTHARAAPMSAAGPACDYVALEKTFPKQVTHLGTSLYASWVYAHNKNFNSSATDCKKSVHLKTVQAKSSFLLDALSNAEGISNSPPFETLGLIITALS